MSVALITGASGGIGLALARQLASEGYELVLVSRPGPALENAAAEIRRLYRNRVVTIGQDLAAPGGVREMLSRLGNEPIDVLVNNAGTGEFGRFQEVEWSLYQRTLQLNMIALTELTHAILPRMLRRNEGQIVNVASNAAFQPLPWMAVYGATKSYVLSFSEALDFELRKTNVKVLAFCPGATSSGFAASAKAENSNNFKGQKTASPAAVARHIAKTIEKRRAGVAVNGFVNTVMAFLAPMSPRAIVLRMAERTMRPL